MSGYIGTKAVLLSTTAASVTGNADIGGDLTVDTNTLFVDSTNNRVGVGTVTPAQELDVNGQVRGVDRYYFKRASDNYSLSALARWDGSTGSPLTGTAGIHTVVGSEEASSSVIFATSNVEKMRIDSSGRLLVGKTSSSAYTAGGTLEAGSILGVVSGGQCLRLNRLSSDGDIIQLWKDGTTVGSIKSRVGLVSTIVLDPRANGVGITASSPSIQPADENGNATDNTKDMGSLTIRWDDVYATNGLIQTSDRNEKQDIAEMDEAEQRVAVAAKGLIRKFRWKDAVAEKGDDARIHFGIIAQDLQAAFEAEGLDAGRYAMFISSTWWEADRVIPAVEAQDAVYETQLDEDGNEVQVLVSEAVEAQPEQVVTDTYETQAEAPEGAVERTRLGVRYPELLAFIIGAM